MYQAKEIPKKVCNNIMNCIKDAKSIWPKVLAKNSSFYFYLTPFFYCKLYLHFLRPCCENVFNFVCIVSAKSLK